MLFIYSKNFVIQSKMIKKMGGEEGFKLGALNPIRGSVLIYGSVINKVQLIYVDHFAIYLGV